MEQAAFDISILSASAFIIFAAFLFGGIIDAVCGGGGLLTVPAMLMIGMPSHVVVSTNQLSAIFGCGTALYKYTKTGHMDYHAAFLALPFTLAGAVIGARLNLFLSEHYLQIIMVVLLPILAVVSLFQKDFGDEDHSDEIPRRRLLTGTAVIGLLVSAYHAFYGPASGMFFMTGFAMFLRCGVLKANGIARLQLMACNTLSGLIYAFSGYFCWKAVIVCTIGYMIGNWVGAIIATKEGARFVKPVYYCVLTVLFIKLIIDIIEFL